MSRDRDHKKSKDILALQTSLGTKSLDAAGRLLLLWKDHTGLGLPSSRIKMTPEWNPGSMQRLGFPGGELKATPSVEVLEAVRGSQIKIPFFKDSRSKAFLRGIRRRLSDNDQITLEIGGTDFETGLRIQEAFTTPVLFRGSMRTLKECYESRLLDIFKDCFGILFIHVIILTEDGYLLLGQRHDDDTVHFCKGQWCVSADEQFDPCRENQPFQTVLRCLGEEWLTEEWVRDHKVSEEDVRLIAVGREWGINWNTALVYAVQVQGLTHDMVFELWEECEDKSEHQGIAALRMHTEHDLATLLTAAERNEFDRTEFLKECDIEYCGLTTNNKFHDTMGLASVLLATRYLRAQFLSMADVSAKGESTSRDKIATLQDEPKQALQDHAGATEKIRSAPLVPKMNENPSPPSATALEILKILLESRSRLIIAHVASCIKDRNQTARELGRPEFPTDDKTVGLYLSELEELKLAHRPAGPKGGYTYTAMGAEFLSSKNER